MKDKDTTIERPPVVVVMGHIDHGKSTLLDFIRNANTVLKEAGGITQHISSYEVNHMKDGKNHSLTFLDTPGHEAFKGIRSRGASVADIAILVVSAEDGVKPQTLEAQRVILEAKMPYIVAINKIDKPGANIDRVKQSLAENDIFLEGYGGTIPWVPVSAKVGTGIDELLGMILLVAELEGLTGNPKLPGSGIIIESNLDTKKGISASAIVKNGTLEKGGFVVSGTSFAPLRIMENFLGKPVESISFSSPVRIVGWDSLPKAGDSFISVSSKKEALLLIEAETENLKKDKNTLEESSSDALLIPIIIKTDSAGSLDALIYEIKKLRGDRIAPKIVLEGIGPVSENDIHTANTDQNSLIIAFHTKVDPKAANLAERLGMTIHSFDIIYKLTEWLAKTLEEKTPSIEVEEILGTAKVLKTFSKTKDKQILGGRVESGVLSLNDQVKIFRRDLEISRGRVRELQVMKQKTNSVSEENEFGALIEAKFEIAPGDKIVSFTMVKK